MVQWVDRHLIKIFWSIVALITGLLLYGAWWSYVRFGYTSDGFHVYSAMRNFVEGVGSWGLWEGPTFEHKMGNHSFLVLFLFLPIIAIIRHPFVLVVISAAAHLFATRMIFNWARETFKAFRNGSSLSVLAGLLYLFYLSGFVFFTGSHSLFIPEVLLPMGLLGLAYSVYHSQPRGFLIWFFFILLIKEEFLLTSPSMVVWAVALDLLIVKSVIFRSKRFWLQLGAVYALGFALSAGSTVHYRHLNEFNHAHLQLDLDYVLHPLAHWGDWVDCASVMRRLLTPIAPLLVVAFWFGSGASRALLMLSIFLFVVMRCAGNLLLYQVTRDISHWTYVVISPTVFVAIFECLKANLTQKKVTLARERIMLASLVLSLAFALRYDRGVFSYTFFRDAVWGEQALAEHEPNRARFGRIYQEVVEKIGPTPVKSRLAIAVPEYFMWPFMDRSHVSIEWLLDNGKFTHAWVQDYIRHIIIPNARPVKAIDQAVLDARYQLIAEPEGHKLYALKEWAVVNQTK